MSTLNLTSLPMYDTSACWQCLCTLDAKDSTIFIPLATQGPYQSHFRWALIKTLISQFFSLKLVIFEKKKSMENNLEMWAVIGAWAGIGTNMVHNYVGLQKIVLQLVVFNIQYRARPETQPLHPCLPENMEKGANKKKTWTDPCTGHHSNQNFWLC